MNLSLSCWLFRLSFDVGPETSRPEYDPASTTASHIERAEPTHVGFAPPEWPEERKKP